MPPRKRPRQYPVGGDQLPAALVAAPEPVLSVGCRPSGGLAALLQECDDEFDDDNEQPQQLPPPQVPTQITNVFAAWPMILSLLNYYWLVLCFSKGAPGARTGASCTSEHEGTVQGRVRGGRQNANTPGPSLRRGAFASDRQLPERSSADPS